MMHLEVDPYYESDIIFTLNMSVSMSQSDLKSYMMKQLRIIRQTLDWQDLTQNIIFVPVNTSICQYSKCM